MNHIKTLIFIMLTSLSSHAFAEYYSYYTNPAAFCDNCVDSWPMGRNVAWMPGYFDNNTGWIPPHWQTVTYTDIVFYNQAVECARSTIHSSNYHPPRVDGYAESTYSYSNRSEYQGISTTVTVGNEGIVENGYEYPEISRDLRTGDDVSSDLQIN